MSDETTLFENAWVPTGYMGEEIEIKPEFRIDSLSAVEWYIKKLLGLQHDIETIKTNAADIIGSLEKQIKSIEYLYKGQFIQEVKRHIPENRKSVKTLWGSAAFRKVPAKVEIVDKELIPAEYSREVVGYELDKEKIKTAAIEDGVIIPGIYITAARDELYIKE